MRCFIPVVLLALAPACGSSINVVQKCELKSAQAALAMPAFVRDALRSDSARRVKLYVSSGGKVRKVSVYVGKEALPGWVHALADQKLGAGEDKEYELEVYEDGDQVYEVTRLVGGKEVELSARTDRTIRYTKRQVEPAALPEAVAQAARAAGLEIATATIEERGAVKRYHLKGKLGGEAHRLILDEGGKEELRSRVLEGQVEVDR